MERFTLVLVVDEKHVEQLYYSFPTWIKYKKELRDCPILVILDSPVPESYIRNIIQRPVTFVKWNPPENTYSSQREKMLTSMVTIPPKHVKTPWYVQIDTDAYALNDTKWIEEEWFNSDTVIVANPWGYTKPANAIELLDDWGDTVEGIKEFPRLDLPYKLGSSLVRHSRIASWIIFCKTDWHKSILKFLPHEEYVKLPFPSQDTFLFYCATRTKQKVIRHSFKKNGWGNTVSIKKLKAICENING